MAETHKLGGQMPKPVYKDAPAFRYEDLYLHSLGAPAGKEILNTCIDMAQLLIDKNISYGNSALEPIRIFGTSDNIEQIKIRIDDKLNRIKNNQGFAGDNDLDDMIGYLILLKIAIDKDRSKGV
jgi:hypothetical protein